MKDPPNLSPQAKVVVWATLLLAYAVYAREPVLVFLGAGLAGQALVHLRLRRRPTMS